MISIRVALFITGLLGVLWALMGLFTTLHEVGVGLAVAAAGVIGWGMCDWMEDR